MYQSLIWVPNMVILTDTFRVLTIELQYLKVLYIYI